MRSVNVAKLKNELSKYLSFVKHGEEIVIRDRNLPVAKLIPFPVEGADEEELLLVAAGKPRLRTAKPAARADSANLRSPQINDFPEGCSSRAFRLSPRGIAARSAFVISPCSRYPLSASRPHGPSHGTSAPPALAEPLDSHRNFSGHLLSDRNRKRPRQPSGPHGRGILRRGGNGARRRRAAGASLPSRGLEHADFPAGHHDPGGPFSDRGLLRLDRPAHGAHRAHALAIAGRADLRLRHPGRLLRQRHD